MHETLELREITHEQGVLRTIPEGEREELSRGQIGELGSSYLTEGRPDTV